MRSLHEDLVGVAEDNFKLQERVATVIRKCQSDSDFSGKKSALNYLRMAQDALLHALEYVTSVNDALRGELSSSRASVNGISGVSSANSERLLSLSRFSHGSFIANAIVETTDFVTLTSDNSFATVHRIVKDDGFFEKPIGLQSFLMPLITGVNISVYVDLEVSPTHTSTQGFTTAAFIGLATKLLGKLERGELAKGIFIPRPSKYDDIASLSKMIPSQVQVINLLQPTFPSPSEKQPILVVCSAEHITTGTMKVTDPCYLVWDEYNGSDIQSIFGFTPIDVVCRGRPSFFTGLRRPETSKFHVKVWAYERAINTFDVEIFSLGKQIQNLFESLPTDGTNILFTTQTNAFVPNGTVVNTLDGLPDNVNHLVIAEVPVTEDAIRGVIRMAYARIVTFVCLPTTPKHLINAAKAAEGFPERSPSPLNPTGIAKRQIQI